MKRYRTLFFGLLMFGSTIAEPKPDLASNPYLNGFANDVNTFLDSQYSDKTNDYSKNVFLQHQIGSRAINGYAAPEYLPPYVCDGSKSCVRKDLCVNGYFSKNIATSKRECNEKTEVCCTYRPPPPTQPTPPPSTPCTGIDFVCVNPTQCANGVIKNIGYAQTSGGRTSNRCYAPEVCCRNLQPESTILTEQGYVVRVPEKPFLTPTRQPSGNRYTTPSTTYTGYSTPQTTRYTPVAGDRYTPSSIGYQTQTTPQRYTPSTPAPQTYQPRPTTSQVYKKPSSTPAPYRPQSRPPVQQIIPSTYKPAKQPPTYRPELQPSTYRPAEQPSTYRPAQQPSTYRPAQQPSTYRPAQQPSTYRPAQQPSTYRPAQQPSTYRPAPQPTIQSNNQVTYRPQTIPQQQYTTNYRPQPTSQTGYTINRPANPITNYQPVSSTNYKPKPTQVQTTQTVNYRPQPSITTRPTTPSRYTPTEQKYSSRPVFPTDYLPPQTTASRYPEPRPTTSNRYNPQPTTSQVYTPQQPISQVYNPQPSTPTRVSQTSGQRYTSRPTQPQRPTSAPSTPIRVPAVSQGYTPQAGAGAYLPPVGGTKRPNLPDRTAESSIPTANRIPPIRGEGILSQPIRPPANSFTPEVLIPTKCSAALNCTPIEYCSASGVISKTPVILTPDQEAYRVPLTDCRDASKGFIGKCCRDPDYTDPWPVSQLGQYNAELFGDTGKYKPNNGRFRQNQIAQPSSLTGQAVLSEPIAPSRNYIPSQIRKRQDKCANRNFKSSLRGVEDFDAAFGEYPWQLMVLLESTKSLLCGGAIIADDMAITSANCVEGHKPYDVLVKAGEWQLGRDDPLDFQIIRVKKISLHPRYNSSSLRNDIAVLHLDTKFKMDEHIAPICIDDSEPSQTENCVTTGWGKRVLEVHAQDAIMHHSEVSILSSIECDQKIDSSCGKTDIDPCLLDVGSALACTDGKGAYLLKGIYSSEDECGPNGVVTFTRPDLSWLSIRS